MVIEKRPRQFCRHVRGDKRELGEDGDDLENGDPEYSKKRKKKELGEEDERGKGSEVEEEDLKWHMGKERKRRDNSGKPLIFMRLHSFHQGSAV